MLSKDESSPMPVVALASLLIPLCAIALPFLFVLAIIKMAFGGGGRRRRRRVESDEAKARVLERAWRSMDAMEARVDKLEALLLERRRGVGKTRQ
jgi:hypothetical protein